MGYILFDIAVALTPEEIATEPGPVTLTMPAGTYLQSIVILPLIGDSINVGSTPGGSEFENLFPLTANDYNTVQVGRKFLVATTIYITGLSDTATIILYKR